MFGIVKAIKEGYLKALGEELVYDQALKEQFAENWELRKLEKRLAAVEKKLEVQIDVEDRLEPKRRRFW